MDLTITDGIRMGSVVLYVFGIEGDVDMVRDVGLYSWRGSHALCSFFLITCA
jgi:hypothetical protein